MKKPRVYLAGQSNEHDNNWKKSFEQVKNCEFYDWEVHSDQTSPETYFPADLKGITSSNFLIANPGIAPSEATWIEIGYFYSKNTKNPGDFCNNLIIVWNKDRNPRWSMDFVRKAGHIVSSVQEAKKKLLELLSKG
jgi:hypothetical protein